LVAVVALAGCGSDGETPAEQHLDGPDYSFSAPADWPVFRNRRGVRAESGLQLVSVTRFPLVREFRPSLWPDVVPDLDRAALAVARRGGGGVSGRETVTVGGRRARRYDITYMDDGTRLVERVAFVLRRKTEYLLLCRYEAGGETRACERLLATFRLT
jgi:hypothetical protein